MFREVVKLLLLRTWEEFVWESWKVSPDDEMEPDVFLLATNLHLTTPCSAVTPHTLPQFVSTTSRVYCKLPLNQTLRPAQFNKLKIKCVIRVGGPAHTCLTSSLFIAFMFSSRVSQCIHCWWCRGCEYGLSVCQCCVRGCLRSLRSERKTQCECPSARWYVCVSRWARK